MRYRFQKGENNPRYSGIKPVLNCLICGNEIKTRNAKKYCSYECRDKSYIKLKKLNCPQCGKEKEGTTRQLNNKKGFCSWECVKSYRSVKMAGIIRVAHLKLNCFECGKEFTRMPSKIHSKEVFCNLSCACKYKNEKMALSPKTRKFICKCISQ